MSSTRQRNIMMITFILLFLFGNLEAMSVLRKSHVSGGQLKRIQKQIHSQVKEVYRTGQDSKINIVFEEDGILLISPPYALVSDLGKDLFSPELMKEIEHLLLVHETGQIFYIKQGQLVDHRLLSGLAEPILGLSAKREVVLSISRKQTSGRPVRIEIVE